MAHRPYLLIFVAMFFMAPFVTIVVVLAAFPIGQSSNGFTSSWMLWCALAGFAAFFCIGVYNASREIRRIARRIRSTAARVSIYLPTLPADVAPIRLPSEGSLFLYVTDVPLGDAKLVIRFVGRDEEGREVIRTRNHGTSLRRYGLHDARLRFERAVTGTLDVRASRGVEHLLHRCMLHLEASCSSGRPQLPSADP